jgi:hypothetical protein
MTNKKPRVFLVEGTKHETKTLEKFGSLIQVFGTHRRRSSMWDPVFRNEEIAGALAFYGYDPQVDFIAVTGPVNIVAMAIGSLVAQEGAIKTLMYNSVEQAFVEVVLGENITHAPNR